MPFQLKTKTAFAETVGTSPPTQFQELPNKMVADALTLLQFKVSMQPIIFKFFDEKFTLPALQDLYEAIYQREVDKRNFRKKLASMNILDKLEEKDTVSSKRGAYYHKFNEDKYKEFLDSGKFYSL